MKNFVAESTVRAVQEPKFTDSWKPLSHGKFIDAIKEACQSEGIGVVKKKYSMNKTGTQFFGSWILDTEQNGLNTMIGLRGSIDKTIAKGICAGTHVTVCSNMMFSGDFIEFRRHTSGMTYETLLELGKNAIASSVTESKKLIEWQKNLKNIQIETELKKIITYDMMSCNVFSPSRFNEFNRAIEEELEVNYDQTLYTLHGAATRLFRTENMRVLSWRGQNLIKVCNKFQERLAA